MSEERRIEDNNLSKKRNGKQCDWVWNCIKQSRLWILHISITFNWHNRYNISLNSTSDSSMMAEMWRTWNSIFIIQRDSKPTLMMTMMLIHITKENDMDHTELPLIRRWKQWNDSIEKEKNEIWRETGFACRYCNGTSHN